MSEAAPESRRGWGLIAGIGVVGVALATYGGVALTGTDKVPGGTTVDGVIVGGQSKTAAQKRVEGHIAALQTKPVTFTASGKTMSISPAASGLSYDASGTLDGLTGFTLNPVSIKDRYTGGPSRELKTKVDEKKLVEAITAAGSAIKGAPTPGTVKFIGGAIKTTYSKPGRGVDAKSLADKIAANWPEQQSYQASMSDQTPPLTDEAIDAFAAGPAKKAMSGPVTLVNGDKKATLSVLQLSDALKTVPDGNTLKIAVIPEAMTKLLASAGSSLVQAVKLPKVAMNGIVPTTKATSGASGSKVDTAKTAAALIAGLNAGKRTITAATTTLKVSSVDPAQVSTTMISEFKSRYPLGASNAARTKNIKVGLSKLNGTYVAPGQQFSLLAALSPIVKSNGYVDAPVLQDGIDVLGTGGGLSQVSTTIYNATFFAGLQEDEHKAHSFWIARYPMGREATLSVPTIDNKWTNDSGHGVVISARTESNYSVIRLYGTKVFSVTSNTGPKFAIRSPGLQRISTKGCIPQPAMNGFKVTVTRQVKRGGQVVKDESLTTTYNPADRVICTG